MQMYLGGQWVGALETMPVVNPFDGSEIDRVPRGTPADVTRAVEGLVEGARQMRALSAFDRSQLLRSVAALLKSKSEDFARKISAEEGKILAEGRAEVSRSIETLEVSAEEARRVVGEMVPLDAAPGAAGKLGFTLRVPCGIVAAITPFNFPLNLVCHKIGPALAAGNAVLLKPASDTPLAALKLVEALLEAGVPPAAIACVTGPGREIGEAICREPRIRKISFTGSAEVGEGICRTAGLKRVTMELGSNSPVIVLEDADLELAVRAVVAGGYANAGQTCISTQRLLVSEQVADRLIEALQPQVAALASGDQFDPATKVGPMVRESDAERVEGWIREAVQGGARCLTGGGRRGAVIAPAVLDRVTPDMKVSREELFGPAVAITRFADFEEAVRLANDSRYGLAAGIFTRDLDRALRFAGEVDAGNLHINWSSNWRADLMPYGGLKDSGLGKEGPRYAIREMTEEKMVVIHG
ncbi:MAG TPA: aldehyde dehydrogenase family protein [Planctomycetaceae bacterium]|nr:aldehyde dehydrogenase family protein [Planctomycetaceae bacterium]